MNAFVASRRMLRLATFVPFKGRDPVRTFSSAAVMRSGAEFMPASTVSPTLSWVTRVTTAVAEIGLSSWIVFIKRTFQPSILRKKRKCGYLRRRKSVGGRKILKRRMAQKRSRLFGA